ncbi:capsular polysaccharide biosynthesis protein [Albirhodobacter sp. R86504]|uniref:capsular polysaccharide biosynthesis protein n=1 Tax=Albirhodobacter sp. R86504 TaxID=3093848 RepID=UPI00366E5B17
MDRDQIGTAAEVLPRRLFHYNLGFLRDPHLRRVLALRGAPLAVGLPDEGDGVAVWGRSKYAARGEAVAAKYGAPLIRIEDAFLRSIKPGRLRTRWRQGDLAQGYLIDPIGVHFDGASPSMLEYLCAKHPLDDAHLLTRARDGIARLRALHLSKYNLHDPAVSPPAPGYVLVLDQTEGDASIRFGAASARTFREMLGVAEIENPGAKILIKTHPDVALGLRQGHYGPEVAGRAEFYTGQASPWDLMEGAVAVYSVSSLMGYEAILAGHKPRIFGQPFYAGWGLTQDENAPMRRERKLTRAQIFAVSHILAPTYYDPCRDRLCSFEETLDQLEAEARAFRADRDGYLAGGMSRWKRPHLRRMFGQEAPLKFTDDLPEPTGPCAPVMWWASKVTADILQKSDADGRILIRVEDGFIRSKGLGAELIAPLSLVTDYTGIYYDPTSPSDLETLIGAPCPPYAKRRAERLVARLRAANVSKYNLAGALPDLPQEHLVLVPGQVEDDASIRTAAGSIKTNLELLRAARATYPDSFIVYKPHPDVEVGLRTGGIAASGALQYADIIAKEAHPIALLNACDEVFTMTSLMGFEALLRGKPVTCTGLPFYAGWGLTRDLTTEFSSARARRTARPDILALAHATLIAYPRYIDPVTQRPCPPETAVERLVTGMIPKSGPWNRATAKLQGWLSDYAHLWR